MFNNALQGKPLPIYGDGQQIYDWLHGGDYCNAIRRVLEVGQVGDVYNIGGWNEMPKIEIVHAICALLDELRPDPSGPYKRLITYVQDRLGSGVS